MSRLPVRRFHGIHASASHGQFREELTTRCRKDHKNIMNMMPDIDVLRLQAMAFERGASGLTYRGDELK